MKKFESCSKLIEDKLIVNTTPHNLTFMDDNENIFEVSYDKSVLLNAKAIEMKLDSADDLVFTEFVPTVDGKQLIADIKEWASSNYPEATLRIIGSIIAVNAYSGDVVGMTPCKGFERVPPAEKRMSLSKFTVARP